MAYLVFRCKKVSGRARNAVAIMLGVALLLAALTLYAFVATPSVIWLPKVTAYHDDNGILYDLPRRQATVVTKYGRARVFITPEGTRYYEFNASLFLDPSSCPDIEVRNVLDPSTCELKGTFKGSDVYEIHRDDASSVSERYVSIGHTFVYIVSDAYGMAGISDFIPLSGNQTNAYVKQTAALTGSVTTRLNKAKQLAAQEGATAYTKLTFTPALPNALPAGWHMLTQTTASPITLDGPDALHPLLLTATYANRGLYVTIHTGARSTFHVGSTCGPTPGDSMQSLPCTLNTSTGYWESALYDARNDYVRHLYYPVEDSLVMSEIVAYAQGNARPAPPADLMAVQDQLTLRAQPVTAATLKNSVYHQIYFGHF